MNLISCDNCGVVIDTSKRPFPTKITDSEGCIDQSVSEWDGDDWVPVIKCPVCNNKIARTSRE